MKVSPCVECGEQPKEDYGFLASRISCGKCVKSIVRDEPEMCVYAWNAWQLSISGVTHDIDKMRKRLNPLMIYNSGLINPKDLEDIGHARHIRLRRDINHGGRIALSNICWCWEDDRRGDDKEWHEAGPLARDCTP